MIFEICAGSAEPIRTDWVPGELELEKYLMDRADGESKARLFDARVFGEQILMLENQVHTRQEQAGAGSRWARTNTETESSHIELKSMRPSKAWRCKPLQYLANYANLKGDRFLNRFKQAKPGD